MRLSLLALSLTSLVSFAACSDGSSGTPEDPCDISADLKPSSSGTIEVEKDEIECNGKVNDESVTCADAVEVEKTTCADGFAFALESGTARVLIRFVGGDSWKW